jgi:DNA polymerase I-like protein with 3'-5' exonuclease and polymerase domains
MRVTVLDVENKVTYKEFTNREGKVSKYIDMRPYNPNNSLVSVGYSQDLFHVGYLCFNHKEQPSTLEGKQHLQDVLDATDLLVGHNLKYDLSWLQECGYTYTGDVYCTQIAEYVMQRGIKTGLALAVLAEKHDLPRKKVDLTQQYLADGVGFDEMPWDVVEEYGIGDVTTTIALYNLQQEKLKKEENKGLLPTIKMMNDFLKVILEIESNGIQIDLPTLVSLKAAYVIEHEKLHAELTEIAKEVMGDRPIKLSSNDFMSELLYSRKVKDKKKWKQIFNIGADKYKKPLKRPRMTAKTFKGIVRMHTDVVHRVDKVNCANCKGRGKVKRYTKAKVLYKILPACPECGGEGSLYVPNGKVAGLKLVPRGVPQACESGFSGNYKMLNTMVGGASEKAKEFLSKSIRHSQLDTYIGTFIEGIEKFTQADSILHVNLNQTIANTGRLSSSAPNFQNQPRAKTFPIRQVITSRFEGGNIMDVDYGQLEFRIAGFLSGCPTVRQDIENGVDVHAFTRDTINGHDDEEDIDRQDAKADTFKPLYGGQSGTARQKAYYAAFMEKYAGITEWHERLKKEALTYKKITTPSGREYAFPYAKRINGGYVTGTTQIVNYPVQGFATADVVPLGLIRLSQRMSLEGCRSLLILTVHDSVIIDVYPGEEEIMTKIASQSLLEIREMCQDYYGIDFDYPLAVEVKMGPNLLDMEEIGEFTT